MEHLYLYIIISTMLVMVPGVDTVLVTKNTLSYGTRAGRYTILGVAAGLTVWTIVAVLGLAAIVAQSIVLFSIIKYLGAAYLVFLGIKSFMAKNTFSFETEDQLECNIDAQKISRSHFKSCFLQGGFSNILNPKTVVVYMTLMPQFINTNQNVFLQLVILGGILTLLAILWFLIVVYILNYIRFWFKKTKVQKIFNKTTGVMLVSFGVKLVFEKR